jgi:hypothetical protein
MKLYVFLGYLCLLVLPTQANNQPFWYTAYQYDGPFLAAKELGFFQNKLSGLSGQAKVFAYVDLANKYYLNKDYDNTIKTFQEAIDYAELSRDTAVSNLRYGLYNLIIERSHFTGHYEKSYYFIKNYLPKVPVYRPENAFIRLNRIKIFVKSFYLENKAISSDEIDIICNKFLAMKAYSPYIETVLMQLTATTQKFDNQPIEALFDKLPTPFKEEGYMNLYYSNHYERIEYLNKSVGIPATNYLPYFRMNIGLVQEYMKQNDSLKAIACMRKAHSVVVYLGDIEVERHYAGIYGLFAKQFYCSDSIPKMVYVSNDEFYHDRTMASNFAARDLLKEANNKIQKEHLRNQQFLDWLIIVLVILGLVLIFAVVAYLKLRKANTHRQWYTTALSHDLRSPLSQLAHTLKGENAIANTEHALISYEYLLDDTLSMALAAQKKQVISIQNIFIKEMIEDLLLDFDFMIQGKQLKVVFTMAENCMVQGDFYGLKVLFRNLLLNAIKHNHKGGFIKIEHVYDAPYSIYISNSVSESLNRGQLSAGQYIIDYFVKQHKAYYAFIMQDYVAIVKLGFN